MCHSYCWGVVVHCHSENTDTHRDCVSLHKDRWVTSVIQMNGIKCEHIFTWHVSAEPVMAYTGWIRYIVSQTDRRSTCISLQYKAPSIFLWYQLPIWKHITYLKTYKLCWKMKQREVYIFLYFLHKLKIYKSTCVYKKFTIQW